MSDDWLIVCLSLLTLNMNKPFHISVSTGWFQEKIYHA